MPNYMKTVLLFILLISTQIICGQNDTVIDNKFCIKTSPLSFLSIYDGPAYKIGTEIKLHKNISTYLEYGGYIQTHNVPIWWKENLTGFTVKSEIKYYLNRKKLTVGKYIALEYSYKNQIFGFWGTIKVDSVTSYSKDYNISKEASCFNLKFGEVFIKRKRFVFEYFGGMGVIFIKGKDGLTDFEKKNLKHGENEGGTAAGIIRDTGPWETLNLTAGIKLGYRIK